MSWRMHGLRRETATATETETGTETETEARPIHCCQCQCWACRTVYRLPSTGCPCLVRRGRGLGLGRGRLRSRGLRDASQTRRSCVTGCWLLVAGSCAPGSDVDGTPRACTRSCSASEAPTATATAMHSPANGAVRLVLVSVQRRRAACKLHATRPHFCTSAL